MLRVSFRPQPEPTPLIQLARPQVRAPRDLRHARSRLARCGDQRPLLLVRPYPASLNARNYRHLTHRTVANTSANTVACTSATSADHPSPARRPPPEEYRPAN